MGTGTPVEEKAMDGEGKSPQRDATEEPYFRDSYQDSTLGRGGGVPKDVAE